MKRTPRSAWLLVSAIAMLSSSVSSVVADPPVEKNAAGVTASQRAAAEKLFRDHVQPLFRTKCLGCHGDRDEIESDFDMRTRAGLLSGGELGRALLPGHPDKSPLYLATLRTGDLVMPPQERNKLTAEEMAHLRTWIAAGAPWPAATSDTPWNSGDPADGVTVATSGGQSPDWTNRRYQPEDIWAYQPVAEVEPPIAVPGSQPIAHPVDRFLAARLAEKRLAVAPAADRRTLLRRATLDLTGLPPTAEETAAFVADTRVDAYERLIERLLASPHYAERQAQHWLDVVRYADTSGFSNDYERPNAWRYRDYVIRSFQADKPYDRFIVEQLAGDELGEDDPELLIATGFLRAGPWEHTGMSVAAVTRQQFLDDVTNAVGVTFLGQAMRCCKCHDHKFDPLPTQDYYRLQAVFAPVQFADREVAFLPGENRAGFEEGRSRTKQRLNESRAKIAELREKSKRALAEHLAKRGVKSINDLPTAERTNTRFFGLTPLEKSLNKIYQKRIDYFERELNRYEPLAFSVYNGPPNGYRSNQALFAMPPAEKRRGTIEVIEILRGGAIESPAGAVTPGVLSAVFGSNDTQEATDWNTVPETAQGRRLALARWIAHRDNTLTSRVMTNRIWQQHFAGAGIVATPSNFGKMGARPSHPELLDWLAGYFVDHGWSVKQLHRLIMTSDAYRRSSAPPDHEKVAAVDAANKLLSYYPVRRLTAEELRDGMLAITGELNRTTGGPGVYPEINWEVAMQPRHIMGSVAPAYQPSPTPAERNRRTIYAFRYRTLSDPLLEVFNRPGSETSCDSRDETTVAPQAFALFNGQFIHDRALALAAHVSQQTPEINQRVEAVFAVVYGREPSADERKLAIAHVKQFIQHHESHPPVKSAPITRVKREMVEELTGESFEWEEALDGMVHYQSDLKPWQVAADVRALSELCLVLFNSNEFVYVR